MGWNYRVMRHRDPESDGGPAEWFAIHEVYYGDGFAEDASTVADKVGYTAQPVPPVGEDIEALRRTLMAMLDALDKPVIEYR